MLDSDSGYHGTKRAVLAFSVASLVLSASGTAFGGVAIAGITFSGASIILVKFVIFAAAAYYLTLYLTSAYVDARTELISAEHNEENLQQVLTSSLARIDASERRLEPLLNDALKKFETSDIQRLVTQLDQMIDSRQIKVSVGFPQEVANDPLDYGANFYNFVSGIIKRTETIMPASRQYNFMEIRDEALRLIVKDGQRAVELGAASGLKDHWDGFREKASELSKNIGNLAAGYSSDIDGYKQEIAALKAPISNALFQVKMLRSVRSIRFWILEGGVVCILFGTALLHYVGDYFPMIPSLIG